MVDIDKKTEETSLENVEEEASQQELENESPNQLVEDLRQQITNLENKIRKVQGVKDAEVAQVRQDNQQLQQQLEQTNEKLLQLIDDPAEREKLRVQQLEAKLERYEAERLKQQRLQQAKQFWVDNFKAVTPEDLADAETEEEITKLAQQTINRFISSEGQTSSGEESESETSEEETDIMKGAGPSPNPETLDMEEYRRKVEELKNAEPEKGLRRSRNKGLEFLRLQREYLQGQRSRKERV